MSSEAITRNDLTNILNEVLPPTPSEYKKLLWANTQGAQTSYSFTADFSNYDVIEVQFKRAGCIHSFTMANTGSANFVFPYEGYFVVRTATISGNTMTMANGAYYTAYNSSSLAYNGAYAEPFRVYGIKYERVAPPQVDDDTGWVDAQSSKGSIDYRIKNGVCYIRNKSNFTTPTGTYTTLFTLPQEYRPTGDIYKVVGGMYSGTLFTVRIKQSDGTVAIADHLGSNTNVWLFDISFVLN